eukprot:5578574-Alexandrium_andersonii.AAC.1
MSGAPDRIMVAAGNRATTMGHGNLCNSIYGNSADNCWQLSPRGTAAPQTSPTRMCWRLFSSR